MRTNAIRNATLLLAAFAASIPSMDAMAKSAWTKFSKVTASDGTYEQYVLLTWNKNSHATRYHIYRSTSAVFKETNKIGQVSAAKTRYEDTGATSGTTYYYWVVPYVASISGGSANPAYEYRVVTKDYDTGYRKKLTAPKPTASDGTYSTYVQIKWASVSGAIKYAIKRGTSTTFASAAFITTTATGTSYNDSTATPGMKYYYWVMPVGASGTAYGNTTKYDVGYRKVTSSGGGTSGSSVGTSNAKLAVSVGSNGSLSWDGFVGQKLGILFTVNGNHVIPTKITSSSTAIATVSKYSKIKNFSCGEITLKKAGKFTLTIFYGTQSVQKVLSVYDPFANVSASFSGIKGPSSLKSGDGGQYCLYINGKKQTSGVTWSQSGSGAGIANNIAGGWVMAGLPSYGSSSIKCTINAKYKGKTYSCTITVYR